MKKAEEIVERHLTAKGCKCDVMDKTKQYEACLNAVNEALNMREVIRHSEQLPNECVENWEDKYWCSKPKGTCLKCK